MPITRPVGVLTLPGRVERAIAFSQRTDVYVAFGRTSAWGTQSNETGLTDLTPPVPSPQATSVMEVQGYKKAVLRLVKPDLLGPLRIYDGRWSMVTETEARTGLTPYVHVMTSFDYDELPLVTYRQLGVYSGLVKADGVPDGQSALSPADVASPGVLEYLYNDQPDTRTINDSDWFDLIFTF